MIIWDNIGRAGPRSSLREYNGALSAVASGGNGLGVR